MTATIILLCVVYALLVFNGVQMGRLLDEHHDQILWLEGRALRAEAERDDALEITRQRHSSSVNLHIIEDMQS